MIEVKKQLPCGVIIEADQFNVTGTVVVTIREKHPFSSFSVSNKGTTLTLAIRAENLPVIQELLDKFLQPKSRVFGTRLRQAWKVLRG